MEGWPYWARSRMHFEINIKKVYVHMKRGPALLQWRSLYWQGKILPSMGLEIIHIDEIGRVGTPSRTE